MGQKININPKKAFLAAVATFALAVTAIIVAPQPAEAQVGECNDLPSTQGLATHTESGVPDGSYTTFARVKADSGAASFILSIDGSGGSLCDLNVSRTGSNGNWIWYSSGSAFEWTGGGGDMRFQMAGNKDGVGLDCIVLFDLTEGDFNPSTKEDCNPVDTGTTDGGTDAGATDAGGTDSGCTPVAFLQVVGAISAFNNGTLPNSITELDVNSNGGIDFLEVIGAINKFNNNQCP